MLIGIFVLIGILVVAGAWLLPYRHNQEVLLTEEVPEELDIFNMPGEDILEALRTWDYHAHETDFWSTFNHLIESLQEILTLLATVITIAAGWRKLRARRPTPT